MRSLLPAFLAFSVALADVITQIPDSAPPWFRTVLPAKPVAGDADWAQAVSKARAFVSQLTLQEKVNLTTGVGTNGRCIGNTGRVTRLGFPGLCLQDSPLGVRLTDLVSAFPAAINVAATFDQSLIYQRGAAMGAENRGKGINVALSPMTNLGRVAAGGRNWEGFGGDPYLAGVATAATVKGYQDNGVIACVKHFVANEQEHYRGGSEASQIYSSNVDDRTMHEVYSWPFAEAVQAGVGSIMCSYNKVNQTQSCQNSKLINGILKEELDFQGFVLSDWAALINGVQPALAGTDMNMPGFKAYGVGPIEPNPDNTTNSWWGSELINAVNNGSVPMARLDDMVTRTMTAFYKMGQDQGYPPVNFDYTTTSTTVNGEVVNQHVNVQGNHATLIRNIAGASTILLKNNNSTLPLNVNNFHSIAVIGNDAGSNPNGPNSCGDRGCDVGTLAMGWGSGTVNFPYLVDPLSAITGFIKKKKPSVRISSVLNDTDYAQVASVASRADTCIVFVNADSGEGYITVEGNVGDRNDLSLWHAGDTLVTKTAAVCPKTVVVMHVVGPVIIESWIDNPNVTAVLHAGLPGQESGNAIVDVLFGAVNPSGRLPYTMARARGDYAADILYNSPDTTPQLTYSEALNIDYRHFDTSNISPRFEFGFGLSYTKFTYNGLNIVAGGHSRRSPEHLAPGHFARSAERHLGWSEHLKRSPAAPPSSIPGIPSSINIPTPTINVPKPTINIGTGTTSAPPVISSPAQTSPGGPASLFQTAVTVSFAVTNTGGVDGHEVSQVYLSFPAGTNEPPRVLRGFARTFVSHGQTQPVNIPLRKKDISVWDVVAQQWVVPTGMFTVSVGSSSRNIQLTGTFTSPPV